MSARLTWVALIIAIALVTGLAQLDRQARRDASLAAHIPEAVASLAYDQRVPSSLDEARAFVSRRPMEARAWRLLAQAEANAGRQEQARAAILQAGRLGWRDGPTQLVLLQDAAARGNSAEAARRVAALMLTQRDDAVLGAVVLPVLADPDAREELAIIAANAPRWRDRFIARARRILPPTDAALLVSQVGSAAP